jgi:hypothetical protein
MEEKDVSTDELGERAGFSLMLPDTYYLYKSIFVYWYKICSNYVIVQLLDCCLNKYSQTARSNFTYALCLVIFTQEQNQLQIICVLYYY